MAKLLPPIKTQFFDANGDPLAGGKVYSYLAGTSTPSATYTDFGGLTEHANPVVLDANGEASIWLADRYYKFVVTNSADVTLRTVDNVTSFEDVTTAAATSAAAAAAAATAAATSATTATTQATSAADSATAAAGSATTATTQAANAATSASTATTQASNASTSATNAATSETNAANSATAASGSASAAALSETAAASSAAAFLPQSDQLINLGLAASVSSNALTIALKTAGGADPSVGSPVKIGFRNATAATGQFVERTVTSALSLVVSSGSTLGHLNGEADYIYVYAIDTGSGVVLGVSSIILDEGTLQSSTAEGGAGAADSLTVLYTASAQTSKPIRLFGRMKSTQTTAGTWAAAPTEISLTPFSRQPASPSEAVLYDGNGYGSTATCIRRFATTVRTGNAVSIVQSSTQGDSVVIRKSGMYGLSYTDGQNAGEIFGISRNASTLNAGIQGLAQSEIIDNVTTQVVSKWSNLATTIWLNAGDVLRAHSEGSLDATIDYRTKFRVAYLGTGIG